MAGSGEEPPYSCQATLLPYATEPLNPWDIRQSVEDYRSGNVGLWRIFCGAVYSMYFNISEAGIGVGPAMRWLYNKFRFRAVEAYFPGRLGPSLRRQPPEGSTEFATG